MILAWTNSLNGNAFAFYLGQHSGLPFDGKEKTRPTNLTVDTVGSVDKYCLNRIFVVNQKKIFLSRQEPVFHAEADPPRWYPYHKMGRIDSHERKMRDNYQEFENFSKMIDQAVMPVNYWANSCAQRWAS